MKFFYITIALVSLSACSHSIKRFLASVQLSEVEHLKKETKQNAEAVLALIKKDDVEVLKDGSVKVKKPEIFRKYFGSPRTRPKTGYFSQRFPLCSSEEHTTELSLSTCSGVLIGKDLVLTAGHFRHLGNQ